MTRPNSCTKRNSVKRLVAVAALLAMNAAGNAIPIAAQELSPELQRLARGDYVWSLEFPRENPGFLGYVSAFVQSVRAVCKEYPATAEEVLFAVVWMSSAKGGLSLGTGVMNADAAVAAPIAAAIVASRNAAEAEFKALLKSGGCTGNKRLTRLMENARRMLEGRRPVHGGPVQTTLLDESIVPPAIKHNYFSRSRTAMGPMTSTELAVFERQLAHEASRGSRILECTYDSVVTDEIREVQYYWSGPLSYTAWYPLPETFAYRVMNTQALELALSRASHEARVRHPFRDYGPPRSECPARLDPHLPHREVSAPRVNVNSAPEATTLGEPVMTELPRGDRTYAYGPAPEAFVPQIPTLTGPTLTITMEKVRTGSLTRIKVGSVSEAWMQLTAGDWLGWQRKRAADAALISEDLQAISPTSSAAPANPVLTCEYLSESQGIVSVVRFWYRQRPASAAPERLRARVKDHPLLLVKAPRDTCPARYADASASQ